MAYDLALGRPARYRALVALSSWLPDLIVNGLRPDPARAALATLLIHGTRDPMIAIENAKDAKAKLEALGLSPAWGEYDMAHEINQSALRDLLGWLAQGPFGAGSDPSGS
jgi:phospholipase/carboxylesterase